MGKESGKGRDEGVLRKKPIIRLSNGEHSTPYDISGKPMVFLPLKRAQIEYTTVSQKVIQSKGSKEFIKDKLGIKEPDLFDEIKQHIIPLYKNGLNSFPSNKKHLEHFEFIIDVYEKSKDSVRFELIELIKMEETYFFQVIEAGTEKSYYSRADLSYFRTIQLEE